LPIADSFAVIEHGRVVLFALADDDDAIHAHRAQQQAERGDGRTIALFLLSSADPARGGQRRGLRRPHKFQRQITIGCFRHYNLLD